MLRLRARERWTVGDRDDVWSAKTRSKESRPQLERKKSPMDSNEDLF